MSTLALGSGCKYGGRCASRLLTSRSPVPARGPRVGDPCSDPCHAEAGGVRVKGGSVFLCPQTHRPLSPNSCTWPVVSEPGLPLLRARLWEL